MKQLPSLVSTASRVTRKGVTTGDDSSAVMFVGSILGVKPK